MKIIDVLLEGFRFSSFFSSGDEFELNVNVILLLFFEEGWELLRVLGCGLDIDKIRK